MEAMSLGIACLTIVSYTFDALEAVRCPRAKGKRKEQCILIYVPADVDTFLISEVGTSEIRDSHVEL